MSRQRTAGSSPLLQYILLAVTWGSSFFFVSVGLQGLAPAQVVLVRLIAGALALAVLCIVTRQRLPVGRMIWAHLFVVAMLLCVVPFLLFAWAQQHVASSVASIMNATTPLMTMAVALVALPAERPDRWRVGGLAVGFLGVLVVLAPWRGDLGGGSPLGALACLAATASYGVAFVYLRRFVAAKQVPAIPLATAQVALAAAVMLALSPWIAMQPVRLTPNVVLAVLALGIFGTGLAYVWNTSIVSRWGATAASTVTYLAPVVGIALGVTVLGERLGWYQPVGAAIVVLGILISQRRIRIPARLRAARQR